MTRLVFDNIFETVTDSKEEAADLQFRADLILTLRGIFHQKGWNNSEIASALAVPQSRVSELLRGKVHLFSADRLIGFLAKLDIRLKPAFSEEHKVICDVYERV
jgi:predicted XRE-type DNA-binding protein